MHIMKISKCCKHFYPINYVHRDLQETKPVRNMKVKESESFA